MNVQHYIEIRSQADMDQILDKTRGFHDTLTKEIHIANRGFVAEDRWPGQSAHLTSEIPSPDAIGATALEGNWRQCLSCHEAWEESTGIQFSRCPNCGRLTELQTPNEN